MKTIIALLILVSTVAYGQVDSVAFYKLDKPLGMESYFINPNLNEQKYLWVDDNSVTFGYIIEKLGVNNDLNTITILFNEFQRILQLNGVTEANLISYVPVYYDAGGKKYPFTIDGLIQGYEKEGKNWNNGKFGFTFDKGNWRYIISLYHDQVRIIVQNKNVETPGEYIEVFKGYNN